MKISRKTGKWTLGADKKVEEIIFDAYVKVPKKVNLQMWLRTFVWVEEKSPGLAVFKKLWY